jgi:predicted double-glycine peptidase
LIPLVRGLLSVARRLGGLGATALLLALSTQASAEPALGSKPVRSLMDFRNEGVVRQHWDLSCGAAAIATVLTYQLDRPTSEREAAVGMLRSGDARLVRARLGFSLLDLKRFAASRGFEAEGYANLELDDLVAMAPVVAPIRVRGFPHFVVLRGRLGDRLLLADPAYGNRVMTERRFRQAWPSRIGFVVHPPGDLHPPNRMGAPRELFAIAPGDAVRASVANVRHAGDRS